VADACQRPTFVNKMDDLAFQVNQLGAEEFERFIEKKKTETIEVLEELGEL